MVLPIKSTTYGLAAVVAFAAGWQINGWRLNAKLEQERAGYAKSISALALEAEALQERHLREVARVEGLRRDLADSVAEAAALRDQERSVEERVVTREVIRYVETDNARECGLSADGVRIHDRAARGGRDGMPGPAGTTAGAAGGAVAVTNARLLPAVVENYQVCNATRDQLIALQAWARGLSH